MHDYIQDKHERRKRKKNFRLRLVIYGFICVICVVGILFILHSDWYTVREIRIEGDGSEELVVRDVRELTSIYIENRSWFSLLFLNKRSFFGFNTKGLAEYISEKYPLLANISISKNYFSKTVTITGELREKFALWCSVDEQCGWFDKNGVVFVDGFLSQGQLINKIISPSSDSIVLGSHIPIEDNAIINDIFLFLENVEAPNKQLIWDPVHEELICSKQSDYPQIVFSIRQNPLYALEEFKKIPHKEKLSYVDLRITNRIFYR